MKIIRNTELFTKLKKTNRLGKNNPNNVNELWTCLFEDGSLIDDEIPILIGGLDGIKVTKNQVCFLDIGSSVGGQMRNNSFCVRRNLKNI